MYSSQHKFAPGDVVYFPSDTDEVTRDTVVAVIITAGSVRYSTAYGRDKHEVELYATPSDAFDAVNKI